MRKNKEFHPNKTVADEQMLMLRKPVENPETQKILIQRIIDSNRDWDGDFVCFNNNRYFVDVNGGVFEQIFD